MRLLYHLLIIGVGVLLTGAPLRAQLQSQSTAPYVLAKVSYGFAANSQRINEEEIHVDKETFTTGVYGSYARGVQLSLGVGKMLNSTLGIELGAQYLPGSTIRTRYASAQDNIAGQQTERMRGLVITPLIVLRNSGDLLSIYTKLGPAIAVVSSRTEQQEFRYELDGQPYFVITESLETARPKVGLAACFGLSFRITELVSFFAEANGQILALPITRGRYTRYEVNGANKLPALTTSEKEWVYERSGFFDAAPSTSSPATKLYTPANYSSVGIGIGLIYHFQ